ncbi:hypothetical protein ElyMa_000898100 [Elysia marginata]|uniref:Uncharacterized protein n=1 Tax=Elysia marginata TaxID=1093978 RepID=A0AAV4HAK4_9GAST|nr:hypothetical protein ElyMa_000898100 [Elysia marginata]
MNGTKQINGLCTSVWVYQLIITNRKDWRAIIVSVLVPVTAVLLVTLLIYGYVNIPRAQDAFYTLLTRAGQLISKGKESEKGLDIRHFLSRPKRKQQAKTSF